MASRRRSGFPVTQVAIAAAALLGGGGLIWGFSRHEADPMDGETPFSASEYRQNFFGMRGNRYVVTGTITEQLRRAPDRARLFSLSISDASGDKAADVGVLVPGEFGSENIQTGQKFRMLVEIDNDGLLVVKQIRKS